MYALNWTPQFIEGSSKTHPNGWKWVLILLLFGKIFAGVEQGERKGNEAGS